MRWLWLLLAIATAAGLFALKNLDDRLDAPLALDAPRVIAVPAGSNLRELGRRLEAEGVLFSADVWYADARLQGRAHRIKAGEYPVEPGLSARGLLDLMVAGNPGAQYPLQLIEGWHLRQVLDAVAGAPRLVDDVSALDAAELLAVLGGDPALPHAEGLLMPDTYHYTAGEAASAVLRRAKRAMDTYLARAWADRDQTVPLETPYEALILASIVEKETGLASERATIAGVFARRLHKRMMLQTDPTVIYGIGETFDGDLRRRDLRTDTPYNTYTRHGLPPTPIALAGRAAIDAVMHPEDGDSLYFVSRGDGSHQFSATLREHEAAVHRYQIERRKR